MIPVQDLKYIALERNLCIPKKHKKIKKAVFEFETIIRTSKQLPSQTTFGEQAGQGRRPRLTFNSITRQLDSNSIITLCDCTIDQLLDWNHGNHDSVPNSLSAIN